jgi:hypothetical protein
MLGWHIIASACSWPGWHMIASACSWPVSGMAVARFQDTIVIVD